jgi:hypothetical protein
MLQHLQDKYTPHRGRGKEQVGGDTPTRVLLSAVFEGSIVSQQQG